MVVIPLVMMMPVIMIIFVVMVIMRVAMRIMFVDVDVRTLVSRMAVPDGIPATGRGT